jgi:hypothetical protein
MATAALESEGAAAVGATPLDHRDHPRAVLGGERSPAAVTADHFQSEVLLRLSVLRPFRTVDDEQILSRDRSGDRRRQDDPLFASEDREEIQTIAQKPKVSIVRTKCRMCSGHLPLTITVV